MGNLRVSDGHLRPTGIGWGTDGFQVGTNGLNGNLVGFRRESRWVVTGGFYVWVHMAPTSNPCGAHLLTMNVAHLWATWSTHSGPTWVWVGHMGKPAWPAPVNHVGSTWIPFKAHLETTWSTYWGPTHGFGCATWAIPHAPINKLYGAHLDTMSKRLMEPTWESDTQSSGAV